jgi:thiaminase (transcriptional activator TenA)
VTFSAQLREQTAATWDAAVRHRFVDELWRGSVDSAALTHYLVQDHQFLDGFLALLGAAVATADRPKSRTVLARRLGLIAGPENDFFARALDALDVPFSERADPELHASTREFLDLMATARRTVDYASCLAVLLVAEWLYLDWATRPRADAPDAPVQREWIDLHRGPEFEEWVTFLRLEFDHATAELDDSARERVTGLFVRTVDLELAFFDAAYS